MNLRMEFVKSAQEEGATVSELCRKFGISRKTGYKWLRYRAEGEAGLRDRSRRPGRSSRRTAREAEARVLAVRDEHPSWGARKIGARLSHLGWPAVPATSTINEILRRHDRLEAAERAKHKPFVRFERERPNELWQMDFKGHFPLKQGRCHALTVLDDHSRYALGLDACADERTETVRERLIEMFRQHGLPERILADNGAPWGDDGEHRFTRLEVWLLRLGIKPIHGRPYHPQTQGKEERFHRTLGNEVLRYQEFDDLVHCQRQFDAWRAIDNHERPHQALAMAVPASRYQASPRPYPETPPAIAYPAGSLVRRVQDHGFLQLHGHRYRLSKAFKGFPVAIRSTEQDGVSDVLFCQHTIARLDLRTHTVQHVR